jgi:hypothetical protein
MSAKEEDEVSAICGKLGKPLLVRRDGIAFHVNRRPIVGYRNKGNKISFEFMLW